jgi:hypothetical protein
VALASHGGLWHRERHETREGHDDPVVRGSGRAT